MAFEARTSGLSLRRASELNRIQLGVRVGVRSQQIELSPGHGANEAFGVENTLVLDHEVNGACELDCKAGLGLDLVAIDPRLEPLGERADEGMIALGNHGRFAKGPAQVRV